MKNPTVQSATVTEQGIAVHVRDGGNTNGTIGVWFDEKLFNVFGFKAEEHERGSAQYEDYDAIEGTTFAGTGMNRSFGFLFGNFGIMFFRRSAETTGTPGSPLPSP